MFQMSIMEIKGEMAAIEEVANKRKNEIKSHGFNTVVRQSTFIYIAQLLIELEIELNSLIEQTSQKLQGIDTRLRELRKNPSANLPADIEQRDHLLELLKEQLSYLKVK